MSFRKLCIVADAQILPTHLGRLWFAEKLADISQEVWRDPPSNSGFLGYGSLPLFVFEWLWSPLATAPFVSLHLCQRGRHERRLKDQKPWQFIRRPGPNLAALPPTLCIFCHQRARLLSFFMEVEDPSHALRGVLLERHHSWITLALVWYVRGTCLFERPYSNS
ncbi:hypothetical protein DL98DRAFT_515859 [Cadophora sp. DSE1049]|nr:hypothetical protein DL98DRAFT_515859 [Cadophora sp. DSE1049]